MRDMSEKVLTLRVSEARLQRVLKNLAEHETSLATQNEELEANLRELEEIQRKGRNLIIQLADKECEYSDTFKLFLCSKLANPHYTPEVSTKR